MLSTDELLEYSLESWANCLRRQEDLATVLRHDPTRKPGDIYGIEAMLDYNFISKMIETLFNL